MRQAPTRVPSVPANRSRRRRPFPVIAAATAAAIVSTSACFALTPADAADTPQAPKAADTASASGPVAPVPPVPPAVPVAQAPAEPPAPPAAAPLPPAINSDSLHVSDSAAALPVSDGTLEIRNRVLDHLSLSGTVQLKAFAHDFASDRDADKSASLQLRHFKLALLGNVTDQVGFKGEFRFDGADKAFGADDAYLWWRPARHADIRGGKFKRPFSQEALQSTRSLYTVERGELYQDFLANTTGYSSYDLGLAARGGFEEEGVEIGYEAGVFNGKQSEAGYSGQQDVKVDKGAFAKDFAGRLTASAFGWLNLDAAFSTKSAEDRSDPENFTYAVDVAYEVGLDLALGPVRLLGEVAWGDNHQGADSNIVSSSENFLAFYAMGVWREEYRRGRASELVLKLEGLNPTYRTGRDRDTPNDGKMRYTVGCNFFFTPAVSVLVDYAVLDPITAIPWDDRLEHSLDAMWRLSF